MIQTNFLAVFLAAIAAMVLGYLWYGPVFGKLWLKLMNPSPEKMAAMKEKGMGKSYAINFVAALVMAYVLARSIAERFIATSGGAISLAFWVWLGFVATVMVGTVLWDGKSWKLYWLNALYYLVSLSVMAVILAAWR